MYVYNIEYIQENCPTEITRDRRIYLGLHKIWIETSNFIKLMKQIFYYDLNFFRLFDFCEFKIAGVNLYVLFVFEISRGVVFEIPGQREALYKFRPIVFIL